MDLDQELVNAPSVNAFKVRLDKLRQTRMGLFQGLIHEALDPTGRLALLWGHTRYDTR